MSAVNAVRALLIASAPVIAICPASKIVFGVVQQSTVMPALSLTHISTVPVARIDAQAEFGLVTSRVQVTAMSKDYSVVKSLLDAVRKACNYQRGTLAGVSVISIMRDTVGPDITDSDATVHFQSIDFKVTYHEPN